MPALDTLVATQLLGRERWGADWSRRDRRGFEHARRARRRDARELARAAAAMPPCVASALVAVGARALEARRAAPAGSRSCSRRIAVEWAAPERPSASTDRLFDLRPSAWIAIQAGGADRLAMALLAAGRVPALVIDTDVPLDRAVRGDRAELAADPPAHALCDGFEDEAWAAAAQVLDHLGRGERPVALVAQDRVLVRRVRALLERAGARIADETGWKMSTTRAGASVMALLAGGAPDRERRRLARLAQGVRDRRRPSRRASPRSKRAVARRRRRATRRIAPIALERGAAALRVEASATLDAIGSTSRAQLPGWLDAVRDGARATAGVLGRAARRRRRPARRSPRSASIRRSRRRAAPRSLPMSSR